MYSNCMKWNYTTNLPSKKWGASRGSNLSPPDIRTPVWCPQHSAGCRSPCCLSDSEGKGTQLKVNVSTTVRHLNIIGEIVSTPFHWQRCQHCNTPNSDFTVTYTAGGLNRKTKINLRFSDFLYTRTQSSVSTNRKVG